MAKQQEPLPIMRIPIAGLLGWLVPGLGHVYAGDRTRGFIIMVTIGVTFWTGVAVGGVRSTVDAHRKQLWFMAQICAGTHALGAYAAGEASRKGMSEGQLTTSRWSSVEVALVYTGVAGLLNVLAILDALVRADPLFRREDDPIPDGARSGAS